jgi:ankyrin repeat protein
MSALHFAAKYGHDQIAEILLSHAEADPKKKDAGGKSAFRHAEENMHGLALAVLRDPEQARQEAAQLEEQKRLKVMNNNLLAASKMGNLEWAEELLGDGASPHCTEQVCVSTLTHATMRIEKKANVRTEAITANDNTPRVV